MRTSGDEAGGAAARLIPSMFALMGLSALTGPYQFVNSSDEPPRL